jgi:excisionase family DNA binding protein
MNTSCVSTFPEAREVAVAVTGQRDLAAFLTTKTDTQQIEIYDAENKAHTVELPTSALRLLVDILGELALGNSVKIVPIHAELTTQEAADLLNVSRPHLVKLLEAGELPHYKTGRHRRVLFSDLMAFKHIRDETGRKAMDDLAQLSEELRMGY